MITPEDINEIMTNLKGVTLCTELGEVVSTFDIKLTLTEVYKEQKKRNRYISEVKRDVEEETMDVPSINNLNLENVNRLNTLDYD